MSARARTPVGLAAVAVLVYGFLHLPILVLVAFSFNASKFSAEWRGFTLQWYRRLLERADVIHGLEISLIVASASTVLSAGLGTLLALARKLQLPIRYIGVGEGADDLLPFDAAAFAQALISQ